jgi:hypothetical protein
MMYNPTQGFDCSKDKPSKKLRKDAERAKRSLSNSLEETIEFDAFCGGNKEKAT